MGDEKTSLDGKNQALIVVGEAPGLARFDRSIVDSFWAGKSPRTIKAYREDLERVAEWCGKNGIDAFAEYFLRLGAGGAYRLAHEFKAWGRDVKKWSPSYVNNHLAALRSLVKFARRLDIIEWALDIEDLKVETYRDTRGPGFEGLVAIVEEAQKQDDPWHAARDTAIVCLMADLGLRLDEVVTLDVEHVDLRGRRLFVKRKKKIQRVWVTMPEETVKTVKVWLEQRARESGPLFLSRAIGRRRADGRLAQSSVWAIVSDLAKRAGLKAWPHALRHAAITEVLEISNGNVRAAQHFGGHANPNVTMRYDDNRRDIAGEMASALARKIRGALKE